MTTPDEIRSELRDAEGELERLRRRVEALGGEDSLTGEIAADVRGKRERIESRIWHLKAKLRTPVPGG